MLDVPDGVDVEDDDGVEDDGKVDAEDVGDVTCTDVAVVSTWVVDGVLSVKLLRSNTAAPAVALIPTAARATAAKMIRICRGTLMVISNSVEGCRPECPRTHPM